MGHKLAIDFGTTNSVIARWNEERRTAEVVSIPGLSALNLEGVPPIVPSLVYVHDGQSAQVTTGPGRARSRTRSAEDQSAVPQFQTRRRGDTYPEPRLIDGTLWADRDAGQHFLRGLIATLPHHDEIDQLVMTVPVASFRGYVDWLNQIVGEAAEKIRIVDESTAAALGYAITEPGSLVLVFDFGGGTLDLSLVQLPENREHTGGFLSLFRHTPRPSTPRASWPKRAASSAAATSITGCCRKCCGKPTSRSINSATTTRRCSPTASKPRSISPPKRSTTFMFEAGGRTHPIFFTRAEFEQMLEANGFYTAIRHAIDKVMYAARQQNIFKEDINHVLLVGGMSLMPSVQALAEALLQRRGVLWATSRSRPWPKARCKSPPDRDWTITWCTVTACAIWTPKRTRIDYDEIIPMGSRYPMEKPIEVMLSAAHDQQTEMEFILGEIDTDAVSMVEVEVRKRRRSVCRQSRSHHAAHRAAE